VSIQGTTSLDTIWIWQRDPAWQVQVFPVKCSGGTFQTTLFLRSGPGVYEILFSQARGEFDGTVRLMLTNTQPADRRYATPSAFVDSNNPSILGMVESLVLPGMTDAQKAKAIYDWVTRNIAYDVAEYLSGVEEPAHASQTLQLKYGTCRDYAILVAALGRAAGLQSKVVFGYATPVRAPIMHAWNEILVDGEWISLDATLGAGYVTNWRFVRNPTARYYGLSSTTHRVHIVAPD
jgi:transglutaminase-like putative cysteine protease